MLAGERDQLAGFLDHQRATVVWKASGLSDEQARRSLVPSVLTTIAGLVPHLALNEEYWFGTVIDGKPDAWEEILKEDPDAEFRLGAQEPLEKLIADYRATCERSREILARHELDEVVVLPTSRRELTVRWVVIHMIEETARHAGHLDLLRELTDGLTGE
jgi:uncharacterized damage-inducible protein DinB